MSQDAKPLPPSTAAVIAAEMEARLCYAATLRSKLDVDQVLMLFCFPAAQAQAVELGKLGVKELKDTMPRHVCLFQNDIRSRKSDR